MENTKTKENKKTRFCLTITESGTFFNGRKVAPPLTDNKTFEENMRFIRLIARLNCDRAAREKLLNLTRRKTFKRLIANEFAVELSALLKDDDLTSEDLSEFIDKTHIQLKQVKADEKFTKKFYAFKPDKKTILKTLNGRTLGATMHVETLTNPQLIIQATPKLRLTFMMSNKNVLRELLFSDYSVIRHPDELLDVELGGKQLDEEESFKALSSYETIALKRTASSNEKSEFKHALLKTRLKKFTPTKTIKRTSETGVEYTFSCVERNLHIETSIEITLTMQFNNTSSENDFRYALIASALQEEENPWCINNLLGKCEDEVFVEGKIMSLKHVRKDLAECLLKNVQPSINALMQTSKQEERT